MAREHHDKAVAHGYIYGELRQAPPDGHAFIQKLRKALDEKISKYPDHKPHIDVSLMENTEAHGGKDGKDKEWKAGTHVLVFVSFPNQVAPGQDIAHARIHELAESINPNSNAAFGLANHWCCYSDG